MTTTLTKQQQSTKDAQTHYAWWLWLARSRG